MRASCHLPVLSQRSILVSLSAFMQKLLPAVMHTMKCAIRRIDRRLWALPVAVWVWSARLAWVGTLGFLAVLAFVQWIFVARLHHYQSEIETYASGLLGQSIRIGHLQGQWKGLNPGIVLDQLELMDEQGSPSLNLKRVAVFLSWESLLRGQPVADLLWVDSPVLHIRRRPDGQVTVAGFGTEGETRPEVWAQLLSIRQLRIQQAEILWEDQRRNAPPLALKGVNFGLDNHHYLHAVHRFGVTALPPAELASRLDVRGEWEGNDLQVASQSGQFFAEMVSANVAAWRPWLDGLSVLHQGRGGIRVWGHQHDQTPHLTVDLGLADVHLNIRERYAGQVPELRIDRLQGRFLLEGSLPSEGAQLADISAPSWQARGQDLKANGLSVWWPEVFPAGQLQLGELSTRFLFAAKAGASSAPPDLTLSLEHLSFANPDVAGALQGRYQQGAGGEKWIDLQGNIERAEGTAVWRYLPVQIGRETRQWVRDSLQAGSARNGKLLLQGDLRNFPFHTPADGHFSLKAEVDQARLAYARNWPVLDKIRGQLVFEQLGMKILASEASVLPVNETRHSAGDLAAVKLGPVEAWMPDLETMDEQLHIKGEAQGPTQGFLGFIEQSPVGDLIGHATQEIRAQGDGKLELGFQLPVRRIRDVRLQGNYHLHSNDVYPLPGLPVVQKVVGKVVFNERGVHFPGLKGVWLGQPASFEGGGRGMLSFVANGGLSMPEVRALFPASHPVQGVLAGVTGSTSWKAEIKVPPGKLPQWQITSDLQGLSSSLPGPLNKSATRKMPFSLAVVPLPASGSSKSGTNKTSISGGNRESAREQWSARAEGALNALLQFKTTPGGRQLEKGVIGLGNVVLKLPEEGLAVMYQWPEFKVEEWQALAGEDNREHKGAGQSESDSVMLPVLFPTPRQFSLETDRLLMLGRQLEKVQVQGLAVRDGWQLQVNSPGLAGAVHWNPEGRGSIRADLKQLHLERTSAHNSVSGQSAVGDEVTSKSLPALDIRVASFSLGALQLGKLELKAVNDGHRWEMPAIHLSHPDGQLSGDAVWEMARSSGKTVLPDTTRLNFRLESQNVGKFLDRLDYPGLVRRGQGSMAGQVSWRGRPTQIDYPSLNGQLRVEAADGQFAKIESGGGKLIGLLSLQSLPRRLLLDFNDVFSEGFAFDRIQGDLQVSKGVLRTGQTPLSVEGSAAQILMQGEANLAEETQDLHILVRPRFGGVASLGAAVAVNPVVGVASLLAQKILQDPLDRILSYQYRVTGHWDDPVVVKE